MSRDTLSREEILSASPSQLNEWIDELMQYKHIAGDFPKWSEDIAAAWKVVEKLRDGESFLINWLDKSNMWGKGWHCVFDKTHVHKCQTPAEAICKAALLAVME